MLRIFHNGITTSATLPCFLGFVCSVGLFGIFLGVFLGVVVVSIATTLAAAAAIFGVVLSAHCNDDKLVNGILFFALEKL